MAKFILAIDQGTTGTTALVFDADLNIRGRATMEFPQHFPQPSWVEHDLDEIWRSVETSVRDAMRQGGIRPADIAAIGITNQRETTCLWNRGEGARPVCRAIVWQDRRTADVCAKLKKRGLERSINRKTGLLLDPYFSATKLAWMLKNVPGAATGARSGKLAFGTIESYLLYRMSGEHRTDVSNASRTLLMNLRKCAWDDDLLKLFGIPRAVLPEILPSATEYGKTRGFLDFPDGVPITGLAGDQQAALFGQACFSAGAAKCTYGTGAFILVNTGHEPIFSRNRLLTTVAWQLGDRVTYGLEGSAFIAGAAVQWLRDGLKAIPSSGEIETLAAEVPDSDGVTFVPALSGMGAPHWLATATGLITGITRRTTRAHIARATLDGIAFQVRELLAAMTSDFGKKITPVRVDGGASVNNLLMQFQADLLGVDVVRSQISETTALGSGLQAGLAIGFWKSLDEIQRKWKSAGTLRPSMKPADRKKLIERWDKAVRAVAQLSR
jgi:glycerol kinase